MKRVPLLLTLIPLTLAGAGYYLYWEGQAADFRAEIAPFANGAVPSLSGFPYRLEARLDRYGAAYSGVRTEASLSTGAIAVNRQPLGAGPYVIAASDVSLAMAVTNLPGIALRIEAPAMRASLRRHDDVLDRLSAAFPSARVVLPFLPGTHNARDLELHVRETPSEARPQDLLRPPVQADVRLTATLTTAGGSTFGLEVPLALTAYARIRSVVSWMDGGTAEVKGARLLGADGSALAGVDATAAVVDGRLEVAGTVTTDCPATVRALLSGTTPVPEFRSRQPRRMALNGTALDGWTLGPPQGATGGPARSQEPPCPALRR